MSSTAVGELGRWLGSVAGLALAASAGAQMPYEGDGCLKRGSPHDWTLECFVNIRAMPERDPNHHMPDMAKPFEFTSAAVVFPILDATASSQTKSPPESGGVLSLNDKASDNAPQLLTDYPCGTRLGKWVLRDWTGQEVQLQVTLKETCWKTKFDEAAAMKLGWPQGGWSGIPATCFAPQYGVEVAQGEDQKTAEQHMQVVRDLVSKWLGGKDPKTLPPVMVAKVLCGEVIKHVQVSGNGLVAAARTGEMSGLDLQGAAVTAQRGRGNEFDMVALLAASYRVAGLPARTVIGWDVGEAKRDKSKFLAKSGSGSLRPWVEFALADPQAQGGITWVPVDIVQIRRSSTRPPAVDRPWPYFGTDDDLDGVIPFAFQFHPPTTVVAQGAPAFYGWLVTPKPPDAAIQALRFQAVTTSKTAEQQNKQNQQNQRDQTHHKRKGPYDK